MREPDRSSDMYGSGMNAYFFVFPGIACAFALMAWIWYLVYRSDRSAVAAWAEKEGLRLDSCSVCVFGQTAFWFKSESQRVYRIDVTDRQGESRGGYAKVGSFFFGVTEGHVTVKWD